MTSRPLTRRCFLLPRTRAVNGTTGDSMSLSDDERKRLAEAWVAAAKAHGTVIINHVGCNSITATRELAAHAQAIGCAAISVMPPFFFKPTGAAHLAEWLQAVGAAAPALPMYYYHFSAITGVAVDPLELVKACEALGVPTFRGFKFTDFNTWHYDNVLRYRGGHYDVPYGRDECALAGLAVGAQGHIGNAFNYAAGLYDRLRRAFAAGDMAAARAEQGRANALVNMMFGGKYGPSALAVNRVMYELKGAVKLGPPRAPHTPLTHAQALALKADLSEMGYFQWCD